MVQCGLARLQVDYLPFVKKSPYIRLHSMTRRHPYCVPASAAVAAIVFSFVVYLPPLFRPMFVNAVVGLVTILILRPKVAYSVAGLFLLIAVVHITWYLSEKGVTGDMMSLVWPMFLSSVWMLIVTSFGLSIYYALHSSRIAFALLGVQSFAFLTIIYGPVGI